MKKKTFIHPPTFICALLAILLVSSTIGTTVWAKQGQGKPDNPGKPPAPQPETFNYQIWIGSGDLILKPYGELGEEIDYLLVENVGYSGRWLPPPTKGQYHRESWSIELVSLDPDGGLGNYCGTYIINNADVAGILGIDSDDEAYGFYTSHITQKHPRMGEKDYWMIGIAWQVSTCPSYPDTPHLHVLMGITDMGIAPEGEYDENTDTWTVTFYDVFVGEMSESGDMVELWSGQLSFTVEITRTPS